MKILQLIDTLNPGGAERMAVNYHLTLSRTQHESFIVATRKDGLLKKQISESYNYFLLKKMNVLDIKAFFQLKNILFRNKIDIIHAHGNSWFWAVLCKLTGSRVKIVWHDHYGNSDFLDERPFKVLKYYSRYFDAIISVNSKLKGWSQKVLGFNKPIIYLSNFIISSQAPKEKLRGDAQIKLISIANLRPQKDHMNLIKAFEILQENYDISLHLFGKSFNDEYSELILEKISDNKRIHFYGEVEEVVPYFEDANIGVISSKSEGLPLVLLEFGINSLPVVSTNTGEIQNVSKSKIILVPRNKVYALAQGVEKYLLNPELGKKNAVALKAIIEKSHAAEIIIKQYLSFITKI
jgi:glycosyltransferase involved in cell wall biosynthesis